MRWNGLNLRFRLRGEQVLRKFWIAAILCLSPAFLLGQVVPAARGGNTGIWVGAEYSNFHADFGGNTRLQGVGGLVDLNYTPRIGLAGEARFLSFGDFHGETEKNYLIGPKVYLRPYSRIKPYAKLLVGLGQIQYPFNIGSGTYFALAPGGGIDYRLRMRWRIRGDYEYQMWPKAPGIANEPSHGLTPNGFSVGVLYRLF